MRGVVQRVLEAAVTINGRLEASITEGLLVLVGIETADRMEDAGWLSTKIANLRIFDDNEGIMNCSVKETGGDVLLISQFTLYAATRKGNRPSYLKAARPEIAIPLYEEMIRQLEKETGKKVSTGLFGADMQVHLINDGPVTIIIDTKNRE
ncbi:MAG: D-aminoacyl-tRNA deacylase [Bacteroidota bacterium]